MSDQQPPLRDRRLGQDTPADDLPERDFREEMPPTDDEKPKPERKPYRPPIYTDTLQHIFDFDDVALNSNRQGFAARRQKERIQDDLREDADAMWTLLTILLSAAVVVGIIMRTQGLPTLPLVIGAGLMIGGMLLYAYLQQSRNRQDTEDLKVRSVQGQAHVQWRDSLQSRGRLIVNETVFDIDSHTASALNEYDLGTLRVYYTQHGKQILAAEAIEFEKNKRKAKVDDQYEDDEDDEDDDAQYLADDDRAQAQRQ